MGTWVLTAGRLYAADKKGYLRPTSVGFSSQRFRAARVKRMTFLAVFTVG
jgi:hypothetical protein